MIEPLSTAKTSPKPDHEVKIDAKTACNPYPIFVSSYYNNSNLTPLVPVPGAIHDVDHQQHHRHFNQHPDHSRQCCA